MTTHVIETKKYIIVKIPKQRRGMGRPARSRVDFGTIEGALKQERRLRGRTSVELQHAAFAA